MPYQVDDVRAVLAQRLADGTRCCIPDDGEQLNARHVGQCRSDVGDGSIQVERRQVVKKKLTRKVPIPDPTPDEPEPIREPEPEIEPEPLPPDVEFVIGVPEPPPPSGPLLAGVGDVTNPTLITEDNEKAHISIIDRIPIITTTSCLAITTTSACASITIFFAMRIRTTTITRRLE